MDGESVIQLSSSHPGVPKPAPESPSRWVPGQSQAGCFFIHGWSHSDHQPRERSEMKAQMAVAALIALVITGCASGTGSHPTASTATHSPTPVALHQSAAPSAEVITKRMGIKAHAYNAKTDPNHLMGRQHGYTSKAAWGPNLYSSIEVFSNVPDAQARMSELQNFTCPIGDGYDYIDGTALLRLACNYTPAQAKALWGKFLVAARP